MARVRRIDHGPVVLVAAQGGIGGAERVLLLLLSALPAGEAVVCAPAGSELSRAVEAMGHRVRDLYLPKLVNSPSVISYGVSYLRALVRLVAALRSERASVVHGFAAFTIKVVVPASILTGVPIVVGVHEVTAKSSIGRVHSWAQRLPAGRVSLFLAVSRYIADSLVASGYPASRVRVVHNGIARSLPRLARTRARAQLGLPQDCLLLLVVARLSHWKGVHVALEAFARLVTTETAPAELVIVGGPAEPRDERYRDALVAQAAKLTIADRVRFTGPRRDVEYFYDACDVVLVPSIEPDPFPTVVLEAGLAGRPVVATSLGGAREAVVPGVTGLVVDPNPDAFVSALAQVTDPAWRARAGAAARFHVERNFTVAGFAADCCTAWCDVVASAPEVSGRRSFRRH